MSSSVMGANEVQNLVGRWHQIVGDARGFRREERREERRDFGRDFGGGFGGRPPFPGPGPGVPGGFPGGRTIRREEWERLHPGLRWEERERHRLEWERRHPGQAFLDAERAWEQQNPGQLFVGAEAARALIGAWQQLVGAQAAQAAGVHPRNYITEMDPPEFARREALPLNSGNTTVPQNGTLVITSRPQRPAFRPERLFISGPVGGSYTSATVETAAAWLVNDVSIGNKSQLAQAGQLPGDMFANLAIDSFVSFDTVQTAMDVTLSVQYVGVSITQVSFVGGMLGTSAVHE
jgi:hypothetical protein